MDEKSVDITLLNYFKDLYSGHKIIYVRFLNTEFVFRSLDKKEFKYIMSKSSDKLDIEDDICNTTCLYPEEYDFRICGFAGINTYVANIIQEVSGFTDIQTVLDAYNKYNVEPDLETQCMDLIKAFIPEYTYEEMESWTWDKLMKITVRAERVAKLKGFNWHIEDHSKEYKENLNKITMDNKEFLDELRKNSVDPMFYFADDLKAMAKKDVMDFPLIGGVRWQDEGLLDVIRKQLEKKKAFQHKG